MCLPWAVVLTDVVWFIWLVVKVEIVDWDVTGGILPPTRPMFRVFKSDWYCWATQDRTTEEFSNSFRSATFTPSRCCTVLTFKALETHENNTDLHFTFTAFGRSLYPEQCMWVEWSRIDHGMAACLKITRMQPYLSLCLAPLSYTRALPDLLTKCLKKNWPRMHLCIYYANCWVRATPIYQELEDAVDSVL